MNLHIYRSRHLFVDDDYVGTFDHQDKSVHLLAAHEDKKDAVRAWFMRSQGLPLRNVLAGGEQAPAVVLPMEFPADIVAMMDPGLGHRTPAVVDYARKNFSREEFDARYQGAFSYDSGFGELAALPDPELSPEGESEPDVELEPALEGEPEAEPEPEPVVESEPAPAKPAKAARGK